MPSRIGPSDAERYGWPGVSAGAIAETCTPIARQIARARVSSVGFILAAGALRRRESLAPLVVAVGDALLGFLADDVGIIDSWPTWPWGEAAVDNRSIYRQRRLAPRIVELAPLPCGNPQAAAVALQATLSTRPASVAIVLVNLAGYVVPGVVPPALDFVQAAILVVGLRRTRRQSPARMSGSIPPAKNLGVVLVD